MEIKNEETGLGAPTGQNMAWMVTFTDLVSLMLTFFVLLFSMSSVKVDKWKDMTEALTQVLNPAQTKSVTQTTAKFNISTIFRKRAINLDYLSGVLEEALANDPLLKRGQMMRLEDRLVIALPGDLLFQPGSAVMKDTARDALFNLGGVLRNIGNQIGINGHTDPTPPKGGDYASNWELSIARAAAVANTLRKSGYTDKIIAFGYASSRYNELPKVDEARRRKMARRVDIVVLPTIGDM